MAYRLTGFLCDGDAAVLAAALDRRPFCSEEAIRSPSRGVGLRCPDPDEVGEGDQGRDRWKERIFSVGEE